MLLYKLPRSGNTHHQHTVLKHTYVQTTLLSSVRIDSQPLATGTASSIRNRKMTRRSTLTRLGRLCVRACVCVGMAVITTTGGKKKQRKGQYDSWHIMGFFHLVCPSPIVHLFSQDFKSAPSQKAIFQTVGCSQGCDVFIVRLIARQVTLAACGSSLRSMQSDRSVSLFKTGSAMQPTSTAFCVMPTYHSAPCRTLTQHVLHMWGPWPGSASGRTAPSRHLQNIKANMLFRSELCGKIMKPKPDSKAKL